MNHLDPEPSITTSQLSRHLLAKQSATERCAQFNFDTYYWIGYTGILLDYSQVHVAIGSLNPAGVPC